MEFPNNDIYIMENLLWFVTCPSYLQWLVKRAIETREEMGDLNRVFSVSQFNKYNQLPEDESFAASKRTSINQLTAIKVSLPAYN